MATFNTMAITGVMAPSSVSVVWPPEYEAGLVLQPSSVSAVWPPVFEDGPMIQPAMIITVLPGDHTRFDFADGYMDGELFGFSSEREETMEPIQPGETDDDKKTISFLIYTSLGIPASGLSGEGAVCTPVGAQLQTNRDLAGYVNSAGVFAHVGDGVYRYTFANSEVALAGGEGNIWLRVKVPGFRTVTPRVPLRTAPAAATAVRDAVLNAVRSGFVTTGTIGEGIALAASLLQGNYYMDSVTNNSNGQTAARLRCFHTGAAAQAATAGGVGEGEFATFLVSTSFSGPNKIIDHRVVQQ